jgi:hypothetical protein
MISWGLERIRRQQNSVVFFSLLLFHGSTTGCRPPPPPLREGRQVEIFWTRKLCPSSPPGIGERFSQTISNLGHAARRCELPLLTRRLQIDVVYLIAPSYTSPTKCGGTGGGGGGVAGSHPIITDVQKT